MQEFPTTEWARLAAEFQGRTARVEIIYPGADAELLAAGLPFDGLRLEGQRLLAMAGGAVVFAVEAAVRIVPCGAEALQIEAEGGPALLLTFVPELRPLRRPPLRERAVGDQ